MKQTKVTKDSAPPTTKRDMLDDLDQASKIPQSALVEAYPSDPILQYVITPVFHHYYTYVYPLTESWGPVYCC
jgi:hypothetical protein